MSLVSNLNGAHLPLYRYIGILVLALLCQSASATENGRTIYPLGPENTPLELPPPGLYFTNFLNYYTADRFNGDRGQSAINNFELNVEADIVRLTHVTPYKILGGDYAWQALLPFVNIDVNAAGRKQSKAGVGDFTLTPLIIGWHSGLLHWAVATDVTFPTGSYDKNDIANAGLNHFNIEPIVIVSYNNPEGFELSAKIMYDFNFENSATKYRSGEEFHIDYYAGWHFGDLSVGINGYIYQQVTDDIVNGAKVGPDGNKGRVVAFGPLIRYDIGHIPVVLSWQHETLVQNRPEGDKLWLKVIIPF